MTRTQGRSSVAPSRSSWASSASASSNSPRLIFASIASPWKRNRAGSRSPVSSTAAARRPSARSASRAFPSESSRKPRIASSSKPAERTAQLVRQFQPLFDLRPCRLDEAEVGIDERFDHERVGEVHCEPALEGRLARLTGVLLRLFPIAGQELDACEVEEDERERVLVALVERGSVERLEAGAGGAQLARPFQKHRVDPVGPAEDLRPLRRVAQRDGAFDRRQRDSLARQRLEKGDMGERAGQERRLAERLRELERASRVDLGCGDALCLVKTPGQPLLDLDAKCDVIGMFGQRGAKDLLGGVEPLGVSAAPSRAASSACDRSQPGGDSATTSSSNARARSTSPASKCLSAASTPRRRASRPASAGVSRRACSHSSAADAGAPRARRPPGGLVERRSDRGVGALGRQGEVTPVLLRIVEDLRQPSMQGAPLGRLDLRIRDRGEQRVCEPHAVTLQVDDARRRSCFDRSCRIAAAHDCVDQRACGLRQRRSDLRCLAGRSSQERKTVAHKLVQARRDGDVVVIVVGKIVALLNCPSDLEGKERVSAGSIVNTDERLLGQTRIQASDQQTVQLRQARETRPASGPNGRRRRPARDRGATSTSPRTAGSRAGRCARPSSGEPRTQARSPTLDRATGHRRSRRRSGVRARSRGVPPAFPKPPLAATAAPRAPSAATPPRAPAAAAREALPSPLRKRRPADPRPRHTPAELPTRSVDRPAPCTNDQRPLPVPPSRARSSRSRAHRPAPARSGQPRSRPRTPRGPSAPSRDQ